MMVRGWLKSEEGAVAVEAALVISCMLVPAFLGLWDIAQIGCGQAQVQEALQDAATYVMAGNASNSSGIASATHAAYGSSVNVSTSSACYCVSTTSSSPTNPSSVSCSSSCGSGYDFQQFMILTVSKTVTIPFHVPYLGSTVTVTSSAQVRTG